MEPGIRPMETPQQEDNESKEIKQSLYASTLQRDWDAVVKLYKEHPAIHTTKITKNEDTALHVAVTHGLEKTVLKLIDEIKKAPNAKKILSARNRQGDTPLHCAASRGSKAMCERMLGVAPSLVGERNNDRETPLFVAALHGHKEAFLCLHNVSFHIFERIMSPPWRRKGGDTILHCTIQREYFDLAFQIIHLYRGQFIMSSVNERGITPLHVLASKPSAFLSGTRLGSWTKILYYCIIVEPLRVDAPAKIEALDVVKIDTPEPKSKDSEKHAPTKERKRAISENDLPVNYRTCHGFFSLLLDVVDSVTRSIYRGDIRPRLNSESGYSPSHQNQYFPLNYATLCDFIKSLYIYVFGLSGFGLSSIKNMKERHVWCAQIMNELVEQHSEYEYIVDGADPLLSDEEFHKIGAIIMENKKEDDSSNKGSITGDEQKHQGKMTQQREMDRKMTALLTAAKNGVKELVDKIIQRIPVAIQDVNSENKNILLVAVENRQPHIFEAFIQNKIYRNLIQTVDIYGNNVLHLAAHISKYKPWQIPGSAMQMQWEIKWYQFVKQNVPQHLIFQTNNNNLTPGDIFTESHRELVKEGSEWLKSTSESCSVVAALIAGVSFATSSSVPGGNDDKTGKPTLAGQPAFNTFAITSLVALCFSVTALVMFLAILTSRQQPKDFRRDLPFKLLLGLSSLFVSIASILISFCAAHFFVLEDKLNKVVFIIYAVTCLPVSLYAIAQFPLYLDLLKSILTKVPQPSYKDDD